jgi:hypothetical protein
VTLPPRSSLRPRAPRSPHRPVFSVFSMTALVPPSPESPTCSRFSAFRKDKCLADGKAGSPLCPTQHQEEPAGARHLVRATRASPMRLARLQRIVCRKNRRLSGYLRREVETCFHVRRRFLDRPSPCPCEQGSFARAVPPLRSFFADPSTLSFRSGLSCRGFVPLRGVDRRCPLDARASRALATFRPQAFSASRRFTPPSASRAYFIP